MLSKVYEVIACARERSVTIALAESLTGGLILAELTSVTGASAVVVGGVVVYSNALKTSLLAVDEEMLDTVGPVSREVASVLAQNVRLVGVSSGVEATIGVSATGVAGPDTQAGKPVGTVYVGFATLNGVEVFELLLEGDRNQVRKQVVEFVCVQMLAIIKSCNL